MERTRWPGRLFWIWAFKGICKSLLIGVLFGAAWSLLSWQSFGVSEGDRPNIIVSVMAFVIDTFFVFMVVSISTIIGLSIHTWDVIAMIFRKGIQEFMGRYAITLLVTMFLVGLLGSITVKYGIEYTQTGLASLIFVFTSTMAFSLAYHVYCIHAVMTREERTEYKYREQSKFLSTLKFFLPIKDRTRVLFPVVWAGILTGLSLVMTGWVVDRITCPTNLAYAIISSLLFTLWGIARRVLDIVKPWGENERLYPAFETYR